MGFQVLVPTSFPVYNKVVEILGGHSNLALPANQVEYFSKFQLWFAVAVAILSGTGQFFWWNKIDKPKLKKEFLSTFLITLIVFVLIMLIGDVKEPLLMPLIVAGTYIIVSNARVLAGVWRLNPRLSGGAIAHIGLGLMLIGVLFSAGYSKVVSLNNTGLLLNKDLGTDFNRDNLLLFVNEPRKMAGYDIEFLGERLEPRKKSGFVKRNEIFPTGDPYKVVAKRDIFFKGAKLYNAKDTFEIYPENTFYEIQLRRGEKVAATLFPRIQLNPAMGGILPSPDISRGLTSDLYTHVSSSMNRESEPAWGNMEEVKVKMGQEFFVNDYVAVLEGVERVTAIPGLMLGDNDVAVQAKVRIDGEHESYYADPLFIIRDQKEVGRISSEIGELGVKLTLLNIHPDSNEFTLGINGRQKDWVIIKAMEKPYINVLWLGTALLMVGFTIAMVRRFRE
jgi:cytochrome c-type biogenesis protein CcmF